MGRGDITREAVLETLAQARGLGRDEFNELHGFERARTYELRYDGEVYDSKAIYAVAYDRLHPDTAPIRLSGSYTGGLGRVVPELEALGFEITTTTTADIDSDRAWLVRAGARDDYAVGESRAVIGWDQLSDLAGVDYDRLESLVRADYDVNDRPYATATKHTNEIFAFINDISVGDIVVVPRLAGIVAIGEVTSGYKYTDEAPEGCHHYRDVHWLAEAVSKTDFPAGFLSTVNARGTTVREFPGPGAGRRVRALIEDTSGPTSWIFQANRKKWNLVGALDELPTFDYEVNQSRKEIKAGDTVYLWLSGPDGGVYASARVLTDPSDIPLRLRRYDRFWIDGESTDDGKLRVWLRVMRVLDEPVPRDYLKSRPETSELPVLTFPNATNYRLSEAHAEQLDRLVEEASGRDVAREKLFFFTSSSVHATHHLETSLVAGIPLEDLRELIDIEPKLTHHAVEGRVFAWGARPGQAAEKKWERLNAGDVALVYREGQFVLWGRVYAKARSKDVALRVWGDDGAQSWDCLYFLDPVVSLGAARQDVVTSLGYQANYTPQGFEIPAQPTQDVILDEHPTLAHFVDALQSDDPKPPPGPTPPELPASYAEPDLGKVADQLDEIGLRIDARTLRRYHLSLKTRGFVVLAGISGGGKTWLAEAYAAGVGAQQLLVAVAPNWTTNEDLLGYRSPLDDVYHHTPFSLFLQKAALAHSSALAANVQPQPFHLILDEMNLARVEYYFARFLSAMEVRARKKVASLELAPDLHVDLTPNLKFIGTVNIDETTFGFADKVYDRAQLVTLEVARDDLAAHLGNAPYAAVLLDIWDALRGVAPFAYRVLDEIRVYIAEADKLGVPWQDALDEQLDQKVLPKIKGADLRIKDALETFIALTAADFPLSAEKAERMRTAFAAHGFASYF